MIGGQGTKHILNVKTLKMKRRRPSVDAVLETVELELGHLYVSEIEVICPLILKPFRNQPSSSLSSMPSYFIVGRYQVSATAGLIMLAQPSQPNIQTLQNFWQNRKQG